LCTTSTSHCIRKSLLTPPQQRHLARLRPLNSTISGILYRLPQSNHYCFAIFTLLTFRDLTTFFFVRTIVHVGLGRRIALESSPLTPLQYNISHLCVSVTPLIGQRLRSQCSVTVSAHASWTGGVSSLSLRQRPRTVSIVAAAVTATRRILYDVSWNLKLEDPA